MRVCIECAAAEHSLCDDGHGWPPKRCECSLDGHRHDEGGVVVARWVLQDLVDRVGGDCDAAVEANTELKLDPL